MSSAGGFFDSRGRGADLVAGVTPFDSTTGVSFIIRPDNGSNAPNMGVVTKITPTQTLGADGNIHAVQQTVIGGLNSAKYWVAVNAANNAGQTTSGYISFTVPSIRSD